MRLDGTVIVVTGTGSGLGKAMATAFVDEGARVVCGDVDEKRLDAGLAEIDTGPGEATGVVADIRSYDDVTALVTAARDAYGPVDVLVNNVGIRQWHLTDGEQLPVAELPVDVWDTVIETNLEGTFRCTRAVLPEMLSRGDGRVIHISSGHGIKGYAREAAYVTTKFGIEGFHESLASELEGTGVESVTLRPPGGGVGTEIKSELGRESRHDASVIAEPAVKLAAGAGENGGRYVGTEDGTGFTPYSRTDRQ